MDVVGFLLEIERDSVRVLGLKVVILEGKWLIQKQELRILLVDGVNDDT